MGTMQRNTMLLTSLLLGCFPVAAHSATDGPTLALEIIERTKTTTATYAVFTKDHVSIPGQTPFQSWSAEFHSGDFHRVESSKHRAVANCRKRTGTFVNLETGERIDGPRVAAAACGINSNHRFTTAEWLGSFQTAFGEIDRVRVTDEEHVRTYDVLKRNGALTRATYASKSDDQQVQIWQETLDVSETLPGSDIFETESLSQTVVPERFRRTGASK